MQTPRKCPGKYWLTWLSWYAHLELCHSVPDTLLRARDNVIVILVVKVTVDATCKHFKPWEISSNMAELGYPFGTMPQWPWHSNKGQRQCYTGVCYPTQLQGSAHPQKLWSSQSMVELTISRNTDICSFTWNIIGI